MVSGNIWFITKFERGHPERGQFLRLGWVRTGNVGDFSVESGLQMRVGSSKIAIFAYFTSYIFRNFTSKATLIIHVLCYVDS